MKSYHKAVGKAMNLDMICKSNLNFTEEGQLGSLGFLGVSKFEDSLSYSKNKLLES